MQLLLGVAINSFYYNRYYPYPLLFLSVISNILIGYRIIFLILKLMGSD